MPFESDKQGVHASDSSYSKLDFDGQMPLPVIVTGENYFMSIYKIK